MCGHVLAVRVGVVRQPSGLKVGWDSKPYIQSNPAWLPECELIYHMQVCLVSG